MITEFAYNGDGVRTSKTVAGVTTEYVLDLAAPLPVVISDTQAVYLYGLDILAQQQAERLYYAHDGLGSVRQLVDTTGEIETNYAYDPFGVPLVGGEVYNPYQFTGEAWDGEVELLYLRARYYQPEVGRFITKDPWPGDDQRPGTLNGYVYVLNSPVNYADPTGLDFTGPGPACPDCGQSPHVVAPEVRVPPEVVELILTAWVPHEILLGYEPDPYVLYQEMMTYAQTGYSRRASLGHAELMLLTWFFPIGGPDQWFGPYNSFTQDVMDDPGIAWFKSEWAKEDWDLPFERPHKIDRDGQLLAWASYARENYELAMCVIGRGSAEAEGRIDPVGGVQGSFDLISVHQAGVARVRFDVFNRMDRPSFGRWPGQQDAYWLPHEWWQPVSREPLKWWPGDWWGTTVRHHFYWYEDDPKGVRK